VLLECGRSVAVKESTEFKRQLDQLKLVTSVTKIAVIDKG